MRVQSIIAAMVISATGTFAVSTQAAQVLTIAGSGSVSGFTAITNAFDNQPSSVPTVGPYTPSNYTANTVTFYAPGRTAYIDFGTAYATDQITATYELFRQYGTNSTIGLTYAWSTDTVIGGDIAAPDFGFLEKPNPDSGTARWISPYTGPAVTPQSRYLLVTSPAGFVDGNASTEWVFAGNVVAIPEPASLGLLTAGGGLLLRRRRGR